MEATDLGVRNGTFKVVIYLRVPQAEPSLRAGVQRTVEKVPSGIVSPTLILISDCFHNKKWPEALVFELYLPWCMLGDADERG